MFILLFAVVVFAIFFIGYRISDGCFDWDNTKICLFIAGMSALLALMISMLVGAALIEYQDNCDFNYTKYDIVKTDDSAIEYVVVDNDKCHAKYTFSYINEDDELDLAQLKSNVSVVYDKDCKPTLTRQHISLKDKYSFWFINWQYDDYTLLLPSHDSVLVN
jgi:hypothetical protein